MNVGFTAVDGAIARLQISDAVEMVTFCLGGWVLEVSRNRLSQIDAHFETGQSGSFVEASCKKVILDCPFELSPKAQEHFAAFMKEGRISVTVETAFDLLVIAVSNNIPSLREACADFLFANANAEDDRAGYTALLEYILAHEDSTLGSKFVEAFIGRSCHKQSNGHYVAALECILSIKKESKILDQLKWYFFEHMTNKDMMWAKLHFTGRAVQMLRSSFIECNAIARMDFTHRFQHRKKEK